jgi:hypothetical protein
MNIKDLMEFAWDSLLWIQKDGIRDNYNVYWNARTEVLIASQKAYSNGYSVILPTERVYILVGFWYNSVW